MTGTVARRLMAPGDFPLLVTAGAADRARPVARGNGGGLVSEEDPVPRVPAGRDRPQGGRAVEAAVDLGAPVPAELSPHVRLIRPAVHTEQGVAHGASWKTRPRVCR